MEKVAIICDGNESIGAGHFYRCVGIAQALRKIDCQSHFLFNGKFLGTLAEEENLRFTVVIGMFSDDDSCIVEAIESLSSICADTVIIDSHRASYKFLRALTDRYMTIVIDDIPRFAYPVNTVINGHVYATEEEYRDLYQKSDSTVPRLFLGLSYFPLRDFVSKEINRGNDILFMAGGTDPEHVTVKMLQYITDNNIRFDRNLNVIVGKMNRDYEQIKRMCDSIPWIKITYDKSNLGEEFGKCRIAISAAGISLYELANAGVPTIAYTMVDNQIPVATAMEKEGCCIYVGDSRHDDIYKRIVDELSEMTEEKIFSMSRKGNELFDGQGCSRIAEYITKEAFDK